MEVARVLISVGAGGGQFLDVYREARRILAVDSDPEALRRLGESVTAKGLDGRVELLQADFFEVTSRADVVLFELECCGIERRSTFRGEHRFEDHAELLARVASQGPLPFLRRSPGPTVVNVTSRFGSIGLTAGGQFRGLYSYAIAKSAQNMLTACLDQELRKDGIRVLAVHPGRLRTGVAAADADTDPRLAAGRLADWVETIDRNATCGLYDLMGGGVIPW